MTAQDLKNSILQQAVQGKLLPQNPDDEPASELLKKIFAERQRLIDEGKIKNPPQLSPISDDEKPFDIPDSWQWVRFENIIYNVGGKENQILAKEVKSIGKYPAISQGQKFIDGYTDEKNKLIYDVPVIIFGDHTRNVKYIDFPFVISADGTKIFKPIVIYPKFFYWWTVLTAELLRNRGYNRHYKLLKLELFPLPPLEEQKRIVEKLEEILPLIERYGELEQRLTKLDKEFPDKLKKSLLQQAIQGKLTRQLSTDGDAKDLLGKIQAEKLKLIAEGKIKKEKPLPPITDNEKPFDIPDNWQWAFVGDTCINIQYGTSKKSQSVGKIPVLRMGNIQDGRINYDNLVYTSDESNIERCRLEKNDLLFNRTNSRELVGKTAIYKAEYPAIYAGYLIRVTPLQIDSDYLNLVMQSLYFWTYCRKVKYDAIGQSNINSQKLKKFLFPLPPLTEQKRIVEKLEEILPLVEILTAFS